MTNQRGKTCLFIAKAMIVILFFSTLTPCLAAVGNVPSNANAFIPQGTFIQVELVTELHSGKCREGDIAYFRTKENVVVDGITVIPMGTSGEAVVASVQRSGMFGRAGGIEIRPQNLKTINNVMVPLTMDTKKYAKGANILGPVLVFGLGIGIFFKGRNQIIPAGTAFYVAVDEDVDLGVPADKLMATRSGPRAFRGGDAATMPSVIVENRLASPENPPATGTPEINLTGSWTIRPVKDGYREFSYSNLILKQSNSKVTGTLELPDGSVVQLDGKLSGKRLKLDLIFKQEKAIIAGLLMNGLEQRINLEPAIREVPKNGVKAQMNLQLKSAEELQGQINMWFVDCALSSGSVLILGATYYNGGSREAEINMPAKPIKLTRSATE